jgi:hypothetical protein
MTGVALKSTFRRAPKPSGDSLNRESKAAKRRMWIADVGEKGDQDSFDRPL